MAHLKMNYIINTYILILSFVFVSEMIEMSSKGVHVFILNHIHIMYTLRPETIGQLILC